MDANCERLLQSLWAAERTEGPDAPEVIEARRHVAECAACRGWLGRDAALAGRLRDLRFGAVTPCRDSVRSNIVGAIRAHPDTPDAERDLSLAAGGASSSSGSEGSETGSGASDAESLGDRLMDRWRRWPAWVEGVAAAAAAAILIAGGLTLSRNLDSGLSNEAIVADFHRSALPEIARPGLSRAEVEAFYRAQFPGEGPKVMIDAPVTKVGVCNLEGRMGAMVEYQMHGSRLVYYQVPREGGDSSGEKLRMSSDGELNVVRWGDSRYDYILVSAMPTESLETLARQSRV